MHGLVGAIKVEARVETMADPQRILGAVDG